MSDELNVITAGIPAKDGCPILTRIKAFVASEGVATILEHQFRNRAGAAVDPVTPQSVSESSASSASLSAAEEAVLVRFQEFMDRSRAIESVEGTLLPGGLVRATVPARITAQSGLYNVAWGFLRDGALMLINQTMLSIEPTLFGGLNLASHNTGCPSLGEIRMSLMDSSAAENVLLDDVEFDDSQIALAIAKPIDWFNSVPPPLSVHYDTTNFPWRTMWITAIGGYLHQFAAAHFRRNRLRGSAGGVSVDDLGRCAEYELASKTLLDEFQSFTFAKKLELNSAECVGSLGSSYGAWQS